MKTHNKNKGYTKPKQEEGRRTTTKSERTSASSLIHTHAEHKKIIDAEEEQKRKLIESDDERLTVDCRVSADADILTIINAAKIQNEIGMLMDTTAKAARSILLRAADRIGCSTEPFDTACMEIHLRFSEPSSSLIFDAVGS